MRILYVLYPYLWVYVSHCPTPKHYTGITCGVMCLVWYLLFMWGLLCVAAALYYTLYLPLLIHLAHLPKITLHTPLPLHLFNSLSLSSPVAITTHSPRLSFMAAFLTRCGLINQRVNLVHTLVGSCCRFRLKSSSETWSIDTNLLLAAWGLASLQRTTLLPVFSTRLSLSAALSICLSLRPGYLFLLFFSLFFFLPGRVCVRRAHPLYSVGVNTQYVSSVHLPNRS